MLNEYEKAKIVALTTDEVLVEALRKIFLAPVYKQGVLKEGEKADPLRNAALSMVSLACSGQGAISNEDLGQDLRGFFMGISAVERGFRELEKIKLEVEAEKKAETPPINEAI